MIPIKDNVPTRHFPVVTVALIAANVLVYFLYQAPDPQAALDEWAYHPCEVDSSCRVIGQGWLATAFSSMFMHGDIIHLGGNMLFLWIFGNNVEDLFGRVRYLIFYVLAGLAATALQTWVTLATASDSAAAIPNLGASGAISGVLGAYFVLIRHASILTVIFLGFIFFLREIPAIFFLGIYFVFQLWMAGVQFSHPPENGGVAVFAHVGGFVFGMLTAYLFRRRSPLRPAY
jgi:membrane associated rhomboid family serine protease